ncbi:MAG: ABC transporter permease [Desulfobacterales bacterium]|nr:ABC transporter permease [Desulfobacterales bacterium]
MSALGKRALHLFLVVFAASSVTFLMVDLLPGDAAYQIAGDTATLEDVQAIREELGLNRSLVLRYMNWLADVARGDLGVSYLTREPVREAIMARLPVTIELMIAAQLIALVLSVPAGIYSGYRPRSCIDRILGSTSFAVMSIPVFVMALVLIYLFALKLGWLPATGYVPLSADPVANIRSMLLPALSIALVEWVPLMRVLRSDMIDTLHEDYILMARSKGLPTHTILFRHALRPSLFTLVTLFGIQVGHLIGGALIVETIFALPGIGRLLIGAIFSRDIIVVQGCILFIAVAYVAVNFLVDISYTLLDPRIRRGGGGWLTAPHIR